VTNESQLSEIDPAKF